MEGEEVEGSLGLGEETKQTITVHHILSNEGPSRSERKERELVMIDMNEIPRESNYSPNNDNEKTRGGARKKEGLAMMKRRKHRLTAHQTAILENFFKQQNTLDQKEKTELAKGLNLKPRQIEVWFQNRRARTKSKQTEVGLEYFKQCCEILSEENRRLRRQLVELRALSRPSQMYMQVPATNLVVCSSCERGVCPSKKEDGFVSKLPGTGRLLSMCPSLKEKG
ncbi:PREDICTED: homeobox-leucine zipper protein HAT14-like isoform X2 [Nelumbo nucifera]|uniref:Homeobox-leucine zipper protein HAT14-like isoform X2 n=1 Tax=Nelumbo nucifera TaxID=4432 RepID=A0A1U8PY33_NELNU|nr:PREDICTED: homeobox-leucine zipper protein HAT14-like isoform X2 [Nelumbo nucifera]